MEQSSRNQLIRGQVVDLVAGRVFPGSIEVVDGRINAVNHSDSAPDQYIVPGLVDAHIHIESSMLPPSEFARLASPHGTVATVSDPHEIANVLGVEGIRFMIENGGKVPLKFYFGAPHACLQQDLKLPVHRCLPMLLPGCCNNRRSVFSVR
ncbi:adenine deaminase [Mariprofundus ferrooxydans PV-1]|uniref:Adenine deaminase n=1 Tax=Mariprofundus ferrooxydans PV-1 TaxID=314345 RepID=Q0EYW5_9PROT|nr:adenine deaminase [Mariprofundus ferrooxydans PV-1]